MLIKFTTITQHLILNQQKFYLMLTLMQIKNQLAIIIKLERNSNNSAATVGMVKDIIRFTKNNLYREYCKEFYDFSDATNYRIVELLNIGAPGVTFTGVKPNLTFQTAKDLSIINTDGLTLQYNYFNVVTPNNPNFTIYVVESLAKQKF